MNIIKTELALAIVFATHAPDWGGITKTGYKRFGTEADLLKEAEAHTLNKALYELQGESYAAEKFLLVYQKP